MKINPEEISSVIKQQIESFDKAEEVSEQGFVLSTGDTIVRAYGLNNCMAGELLKFENGVYGIAMNLEENNIGCVLLGDADLVTEGSPIKRTGKTVEIPVGKNFLGRVINPLGKPIDGQEEIQNDGFRPIEYPAPGIIDRKPVSKPLQTGILAIDSMIPIGRGQRELIIGDRQTGKTAIAIDTIINQKDQGVICIYVAIGQKASTLASIVEKLKQHDAMNNTIIVASTASDSSTLQYISPYAGCAMAEYFMYEEKKDVLIVYDDLSKHAVSYRAMSLLLRRPPGREAYPGDVFYLHSRLLERAACLNDKLGGGSITALPIIETYAGDVSAYIPTNVISITDGQIYLDTELFHSGQRPAVDVGLSVSRVGGAAQIKAMKKVASPIRINLAQYRELVVFSQFGSDLDKITQDKLKSGERIIEVIKQKQYSPIAVEEQVVILFCATGDYLMDINTKDVKDFIKGLLDYIRANYNSLLTNIKSTGQFTDADSETLDKAIKEFKETYVSG